MSTRCLVKIRKLTTPRQLRNITLFIASNLYPLEKQYVANLPISVTVHAMDLFFERKRPKEPVSSGHKAGFGHDETLEFPRELCQSWLALLLAVHHHQQDQLGRTQI